MASPFMRRVRRLLGAGLVLGGVALLGYLLALALGDGVDVTLPRKILEPLLTVLLPFPPTG